MNSRATSLRITPAASSDAAGIAALLAAADLPHNDSGPELEDFLVVRDGAEVTTAVGLEIKRREALLRSLVVSSGQRNQGMGRALVREIAALALHRGVNRLFLLTTMAAPFFERAGFVRLDRSEAPLAIAASSQFQGLCPASAVCLAARVGDVLAS
ncbi:MAG: arsenic resistance N-acetyltransferase ArsN2 [Opitutaceae bacterium]